MRKRGKWSLAYIFTWLFLVVYLGISNKIVSMTIPKEQALRKVNINEYTTTAEPVICIDESLEYIGGTYEYAYCGGWAFCETDYNNDNKVISVIFRDIESDMSFACENSPQLRQDVYDTFKHTKRIYNGNTSVTCKFSTLNLPYGTYEMLINVYENEHDYGIASTGQYYRKSAEGLVKVNEDGEEIEINEAEVKEYNSAIKLFLSESTEKGVAYIDEAFIIDGIVHVAGWASYAVEYNEEQQVYIGLIGSDGVPQYYKTEKVLRKDVSSAWGDASYEHCGYSIEIVPEVMEERYDISVVIQIGDDFYQIDVRNPLSVE